MGLGEQGGAAASVPCGGAFLVPAFLVREKNPLEYMVGLGSPGVWEESPWEQGWETVLDLCCAQDTSITRSHKWERKHRERRAQTVAVSLQLEVTGSDGLICRVSSILCTWVRLLCCPCSRRLKEKTYSLWPFLLDDRQKYLNPLYSSKSERLTVLEPNTASFNFK